jgi:hypothetical protein
MKLGSIEDLIAHEPGKWVVGHVYTNAIRPWLLRILELSFLQVSRAPTLGLHEGSFGL